MVVAMIRKLTLFFLGSLLFCVTVFSGLVTIYNVNTNYLSSTEFYESNRGENYLRDETNNLINYLDFYYYNQGQLVKNEIEQLRENEVYSDLSYALISKDNHEIIVSNDQENILNEDHYVKYSVIDLENGTISGDQFIFDLGFNYENVELLVGFTAENPNYLRLNQDHKELLALGDLRWGVSLGIPAILLGIIFLVDYAKTSQKNILNKIPLEIFVVGVGLLFLLISSFGRYFYMIFKYQKYGMSILYLIFLTLIAFAFMLWGLLILLYLISNIKHRTLIKNSLTYRILNALFRLTKEFKKKTKVLGILAGLFFLHFFVVFVFSSGTGLFLLFIFDLYLLYQFIKLLNQQDQIDEHLHSLRQGDIDRQLDPSEFNIHYSDVVDDINNLSQGFLAAVEKSLQDERMSIELITNVSHDLKTPLTSILNYVQLIIDNENPDQHQEYLKIIKDKALRLSDLSNDVVEASKASSGKVEIHLSELNALEMLNQVLVEYQADFEEKGLVLLVDEPSINYVVLADSQKLYRVYQNLFENISRYALENTRVYVEGKSYDDKLEISFKNISKNQLGSEDLTARFVQGEMSRSEQGNGLGLAIAKDLLRLQNGQLSVQVDGDLFKATIQLTKEA